MMIETLWSQKIKDYAPTNTIEQENVLQELTQHYVLASLARAQFFQLAQFHGGTCLRILHGLSRFSEDLDFVLKKADPHFAWKKYLDRIGRDCAEDGIQFEFVDKSESDSTVKKAFLKTDSIGKVLILDLPHLRHHRRKIKIKLEIDTNPPLGSTYETAYIYFPVMSAITAQTLESAFASKSHALLCRPYIKGRDWFDFLWYSVKDIRPNLVLLSNAIAQQGPWAGKTTDVTADWYLENLNDTIRKTDWKMAQEDVKRFLPLREQESLNLWNMDFFLHHLEKLGQNIKSLPAT